MTSTAAPAVRALPLAPKNPLPYLTRLKAAREFTDGQIALHEAGGPITRNVLGPTWLTPPLLFVASPQGVHDVLSRTDGAADRGDGPHMIEWRRLLGDSILSLTHRNWVPRRRILQPMFTKQNVPRFAGHMSEAAQSVADSWGDGSTVDLDAAVRTVTLRALGRSVFGLDLDEQADVMGPALRTAVTWIADRAFRPVRAPEWLPTPARRRVRKANAVLNGLAAQILQQCRANPDRDAPLVHALITASDPETGQRLTDDAIRRELIVFMVGGHDTTATTLAYALWQLGHCRDLQDRAFAEISALGDVVPAGAGLRADDQLRHRGRRLPGRSGHLRPSQRVHDAPRSRAVGRSVDVRPRPVHSGAIAGPRSLAIHTIWWRPAEVHRRPLRHARGHPGPGHHRSQRRSHVPG
jgi:cytochrome P450